MPASALFHDADPDWPYAWPRPRGLDDAGPRIAWLRQCYRSLIRMMAIRIHYGLDSEETFCSEVTIPAVCLCQRLGWPTGLGVTATDAERKAWEDEGPRHHAAIRKAVWPLARDELPGTTIMKAALTVNDRFDYPMSRTELLDIVRRITTAASRGKRHGG